MDKKVILKFSGILIGLFLLTTVTVFFLYPHLNEEGYEEAVESVQTLQNSGPVQGAADQEQVDEGSIDENTDSSQVNERPQMQDAEIISMREELQQNFSVRDTCINDNNELLLARIDSLEEVNRSYESELAALNEQLIVAREAAAEQNTTTEDRESELLAEDSQMSQEEFFDRTKSLLNLDREELAPIVAELSKQEIVRLYNGGGTIQREKLLRSLEPERAAEIMKEIML
jgi:hypothetical protein